VNGARLNGWLTAIAEFGKNPQGGVTRLAYSDADLAARAYTVQLMRDARLDVSIDAAGNIFGKRAGTDAAAKPVIFGSHVDSVPEGGNYDGNVGTLAAIEVARTLASRASRRGTRCGWRAGRTRRAAPGKPRRDAGGGGQRAGHRGAQRQEHQRRHSLHRR